MGPVDDAILPLLAESPPADDISISLVALGTHSLDFVEGHAGALFELALPVKYSLKHGRANLFIAGIPAEID